MSTESGVAGVLVAGLAAVAMVLGLLVADVARTVATRAQVTAAADAAALAAAPATFARFGTSGDPVRAAAEMAAANGVELVECSCRIDRSWETRRVTVTVTTPVDLLFLGDRLLTATAAAEFRPIALAGR